MRVAFFDTHRFDKEAFFNENRQLAKPHEINFFNVQLTGQTALMAAGYPAVCPFVNDDLNSEVISQLASRGLKLIALRSAGYNNVDLKRCRESNVTLVRVPAYSPHAVAEHALALLICLNRKIHRAYGRIREFNFSLDGLTGFDLNGKTVGIIGTGRIGSVFARIMWGLGCQVLACDPVKNRELTERFKVEYVSLDELFRRSDIVSLQTPLTPETRHLVNAQTIAKMKHGVVIINTGRGRLIDSKALVDGLKHGQIGGAGLDVYEEEEGVFFQDLSGQVLLDDVLARLLSFPNVIITAHQGFLTAEALQAIAQITLRNITDFENGAELENEIK